MIYNVLQEEGEGVSSTFIGFEKDVRRLDKDILIVFEDIDRIKDPDIVDPIRFLRAREVVHFQRFGEALRSVQDELNSKNFYAFNPSFDAKTFCAAPRPGAGQGNCCTR